MKVLCALLAVVLSLDATLNKPGKELVVITNRTMSSAIFMEFSAPSYKNCFSSCLVVQRCTVFSFKPRENGSLCYLGDSISFNDSFPKFPGSVLGLFFVSGFWHGPDNYTYWSPRTMLSYLDAVDECKKNNMRLGIYKNLTSFKMLKAYAEISAQKHRNQQRSVMGGNIHLLEILQNKGKRMSLLSIWSILVAAFLSVDAIQKKTGKELVVILNRTMSASVFRQFTANSLGNCLAGCLVRERCAVFSFEPQNSSLCQLGDSISFTDSFPKAPGSILGMFLPSGFWHGPDNFTYWSPGKSMTYQNAVDACNKTNMRLGIYKTHKSLQMLKAYAEIHDKIWVDLTHMNINSTKVSIWGDGTDFQESEVGSVAALDIKGNLAGGEKWIFWFVKPKTFKTKRDEQTSPFFVLCQGISLFDLMNV